MRPLQGLCAICFVLATALSFGLSADVAAEESIAPPSDYHVEEGIWIREHGLPATAWGQHGAVSDCLNLSSSTARLDIAYVIRSPNPDLTVTATFILYRNSDTRVRFLDNGTLLSQATTKGCSAGAAEPVRPFWIDASTKHEAEPYQGHFYYLVLKTFDLGAHSGLYQLRLNVSGVVGGSSWEGPSGNPRVPWVFFRVPSGAGTSVSPYRAGEFVRAASSCNVTGSGFPSNGSMPSPYEVFIDCTSWLNGSCYGGHFLRRDIQIWRTLDAGIHTLRTVCAETEASMVFRTHQWDAMLEVSPNVTVPGGKAIWITGRGFPVNESYSIYLGKVTVNSTPVYSGAVSGFGNFSTSYQFPRNSSLGPQNVTATAPQVSGPPSATVLIVLDPWSVNLTVRPLQPHQGDWLDINGSDYPFGCHLEVSVDNTRIYEGMADENGTFYCRAYTLDPLFNPGWHTISANATDYAGSACGRVEVQVLQYDARISVHPKTSQPGTLISIDGEGFPPNDFVRIQLGGYLLSELVTGPKGSFHVECDLPRNSSLGRHVVRAYAPRYGGPPSGNATLDIVQWPVQATMNPAAPHPGGWVRIAGRGLPPSACYEVYLNGSFMFDASTGPTGEFDQVPSLPLNISLGAYIVEVVVPHYTGPPTATFKLQIIDWSPLIQLVPANPRPGEALQIVGRGYPRSCLYTIRLDGAFIGNGTSLVDGSFAPYIFLRSNLSIGVHLLNITVRFPEFPPTTVEFSAEPWRLSLSISPRSGPKGTTVNLQVEGCPPLCEASIWWNGDQLRRCNCTMAGTLAVGVVLNYQADEAYHKIMVRCEGGYAGSPSAYGYFWLGDLPPVVSVSARDDKGNPRSSFFANETVYATGAGLPRLIDAWLYLLNGSNPTRQQGPITVRTNSSGSFTVELLHSAPLRGEFGLWLDVNCNGLLDANDVLSQPAFTSVPRPQLVMAHLEPSKSIATQGETVSILVTVENRGAEPQSASIHVTYGSLEIATAQVSSLPPNSTEAIGVDWETTSVAPGRLPLRARVDAAPGEIVTSDNEMEFGPLTIQPAPDISILSLTPDTRRARTGSIITFDGAVRNSGMSFETFEVQLVWGDEVVVSRTLKLPAGGTVMEELEWDTTGTEPDDRRVRLRTAPIPFEKNPLDNDLASGTITILPPNTPPKSRPGGPYQGISGIPTKFNGSASTDDEGVAAYEWDFGDGCAGARMVATHTYASPGRYVVQLVVTDGEGESSSLSTVAQIFRPLDVKVWSTDHSGRPKNQFRFDDGVYATVSSPAVYNASLYVVSQGSQAEGQPLKDVSERPESLWVASNVTLLVWSGWLPEGRYDMVLDLNANGRFDPMFDPVYSAFLVVGQKGLWLTLVLAIVLLTRRSP